jgi:VCBS repeat-containing protein
MSKKELTCTSRYTIFCKRVEDLEVGDMMDSNQPWVINFNDTGMGCRKLERMDVSVIKTILSENQTVVDGSTRNGRVIIFENGKWMYLKEDNNDAVATLKEIQSDFKTAFATLSDNIEKANCSSCASVSCNYPRVKTHVCTDYSPKIGENNESNN